MARRGLGLRCLLCVVLATAAGALLGPAAPAGRDDPVMVIGDSIATGMLWHPAAARAMEDNLAVDWQVAVCRTLTGVSCPFGGDRPPTLVDLVRSLGHVPPVVVVEMGYNDPEETFAASVDQAMSSLVAAGAQHVLWLTLRAAHDPYPALNAILREALSRWPQLRLIDWDAATHDSYGWFQSDGIHLLPQAGLAMAHLVNAAVLAIVDPLRVVSPPRLQPGRAYDFRLTASGGAPPYRWKIAGRPPQGFHLRADGEVDARLSARARSHFAVTVHDADGVSVTLPLHVSG